jgi:hypothetical protein
MAALPQLALPQARLCHFAHGRLRVKIPEKRRDQAFFERVRQRLAGWDNVDHVEVNPLTASVLVQFRDAGAPFPENALDNELFELDRDALDAAAEPAPALTEQAAELFAETDAAVRRWTDNGADLRSAIFLLLVAGGIYQLLRGNIAAPAATLLWYAGATLRLWDVAPAPPAGSAARPAIAGD